MTGPVRDPWRRDCGPSATQLRQPSQKDISLRGIRRGMGETDGESVMMFKVPRSKVRDLGDFYLIGPFRAEGILNAVLKAYDNPGKAAVAKEETGETRGGDEK